MTFRMVDASLVCIQPNAADLRLGRWSRLGLVLACCGWYAAKLLVGLRSAKIACPCPGASLPVHRVTVPVPGASWAPDGLEVVLPAGLIGEAAAACGAGVRRRLLPGAPAVVFVLGLCLFSGEGYREVARKLAGWLGPLAGRETWPVPGSGALARARRRGGAGPPRGALAGAGVGGAGGAPPAGRAGPAAGAVPRAGRAAGRAGRAGGMAVRAAACRGGRDGAGRAVHGGQAG